MSIPQMLKLWAALSLIGLPIAAQAGTSAAEISYQSCRVCHDTADGASIPVLAGRSAAEIEAAFASMAAAPQDQTIMHRFTAGLSAAELADLTAYISGLTGERQ